MNKVIKIQIMIILNMALFSCNYQFDKAQPKQAELNPQAKSEINFEIVKNKVFVARCTVCHQQYNNYQNVVTELKSIQDAVISDRMPKSGGPLTSLEKEILLTWIDAGAPEKVDSKPIVNMPVVLLPTYASLSTNIFIPKCSVCHNPNGQAKFLDLSTYEAIKASKDRKFVDGSKFLDFKNSRKSYLIKITQDTEEPMPPKWSNIPQLTEAEIEVINTWIQMKIPQ